ncbi:MAG: LytR C-terminal domain-containing protein [Candidatus Binatia bacterium]
MPLLVAGLVLVSIALLVWYVRSRPERVEGHAFALPSQESRVVVEVLNGSGRTGLARTATRVLRRQGIDVVYLGNAPRADSTRVVLRRGDSDHARKVHDALGQGIVGSQLDSLRHVDVTVVLGADYRAPDEVHP